MVSVVEGFAAGERSHAKGSFFVPVLAVVLGVVCSPSNDARLRAVEESTRTLREYLLLQEAYFADHGRYAADPDSLGLPVPEGAALAIVTSSQVGHSAIIRTGAAGPELLCAVWVGERPAELDHDRQAEPVCDAPTRFAAWLAAPRPDPGRPPAPPAQSGVLLGLRSPRDEYRTIWIAADGDSIALLARGPGLLVPRADGFWRVEMIRDEDELGDECVFIVAGPAETWPDGAVGHGGNWSGPVPARCPSGYGRIDVISVGPAYISVRSYGDARSGRAVDSWDEHYVMSLDSLSQQDALALERYVPPVSLTRLADAAGAVADSLKPHSLEECGWPVEQPPVNWAVVRGWGMWGLRGYYDTFFYACAEFSIAVPGIAPAELVGHNELFPDSAAIRVALPRARDAVSSPLRDLVVAVTGDSLYAFHVEGDALGRRAFVTAEPGRIVMAEWATGRAVQRWTREARRLLGRESRDPDSGGEGAGPDAPARAEAAASQGLDYRTIFAEDEWSTSEAFMDWAMVVPLRNTDKEPCSDATKERLADSIADVLFCERVGTLSDDGESLGARLVWSIVRGTAVPRYDCNAGLAYLDVNRIVSEPSPADCEYVLEIEDPSDNPVMAFRVRGSGEIGVVVDFHGAECAGRRALLANADRFETIHTFYHECPH